MKKGNKISTTQFDLCLFICCSDIVDFEKTIARKFGKKIKMTLTQDISEVQWVPNIVITILFMN